MNFAAIAKGARATVIVPLPIAGREQPVPVLLRVLNADGRATAVAGGRAYAASKGVTAAGDDDEVFALGVRAHTLAACCEDPDVAGRKFFANADEVLNGLEPESVEYLYAHWQIHQNRHAPQRFELTPEEFAGKVIALAEGDEGDAGPFVSMRPFLQMTCMRIMAKQLVNYWIPKSPSGSSSAPDTTSDAQPPSADPEAAAPPE